MNAAKFRKLLSKHFSPNIRKLGWKGSGFDYRKIQDNHVLNLFGIQGSWMGGSVCCETAIHFDFFPDLSGQNDVENIKYASCILRDRLSPDGTGDYHWRFSESEEQNIESVKSIWTTFEKHGLRFYKDFENFPYPFDSIKVEDLQDNNYRVLGKYHITNGIEFARLLKEINMFIGNRPLAIEFSEYGIEKANELGKKLLVGRKTKAYRLTEESINMQIERLKVK